MAQAYTQLIILEFRQRRSDITNPTQGCGQRSGESTRETGQINSSQSVSDPRAQDCLQDDPRGLPDPSKRASKGPRDPPEEPQEGPNRAPKRTPREPQDGSKRPPRKRFRCCCYTACFYTSLIKATRLAICFWMGWWGYAKRQELPMKRRTLSRSAPSSKPPQ